jgi:hypothetical protein
MGSLYGTLGMEETESVLGEGSQGEDWIEGGRFGLAGLEGWVFARFGFGMVLRDLVLGLEPRGLGLMRLSMVDEEVSRRTSKFVIVRLGDWDEREVFGDESTNVDWLADSRGLSEVGRRALLRGLAADDSTVRFGDGERDLVVDYTSLELGGKVVSEEMICSDVGMEL